MFTNYFLKGIKNLQVNNYIFAAFILLGACTPVKVDEADAAKKMSLVFAHDNSYSTFLRCSVTGSGIDCSGQPDVVPTFGSMAAIVDIENSSQYKVEQLPNGCFTALPTGEASVFLSNNNDANCKFVIRLYKGEAMTGSPITEWGVPTSGSSFSGNLNYLTMYGLNVVNVSNGDTCSRKLLYQERPSYSQITAEFALGQGQLSISSLFSLQVAPSMAGITTASKGAAFGFSYIPALNTSELIAAGVTDAEINAVLTPHLGDYTLLFIRDGYGNKGYCKQADAITGTITVPQNIMNLFNGNTSFKIARYKTKRISLTATQELVLYMKVGQYTTGTDAYGQVNGNFSVWVQ